MIRIIKRSLYIRSDRRARIHLLGPNRFRPEWRAKLFAQRMARKYRAKVQQNKVKLPRNRSGLKERSYHIAVFREAYPHFNPFHPKRFFKQHNRKLSLTY